MSGVGVVVVEVEVKGAGEGGLDSRQGPPLVLTSRRTPPGKCCCLACACVCVCGQVKNTFNLMTVMKLEVRANDFFTASYAAFERSDQSVIRHTASLPPVPCPARRRQPKSPSHIAAVMQKKKTRFSSEIQHSRRQIKLILL